MNTTKIIGWLDFASKTPLHQQKAVKQLQARQASSYTKISFYNHDMPDTPTDLWIANSQVDYHDYIDCSDIIDVEKNLTADKVPPMVLAELNEGANTSLLSL